MRVGGSAARPSWPQRSGLGQLARALCVSVAYSAHVMSKIRSPWLALFAGVMLIVLSLSTALAGKPSGTNHGQQVSSQARSQAGTAKSDGNDSSSSTHSPCVSKVAQSDAHGGKNDNHGGAVSEAARNTCANDHSASKPETKGSDESPSESESESEAESPGD
jgi:hypothetical protein